jgi:hypothetical protein
VFIPALICVVALLGILLLAIALRPAGFRVSRSETIAAAPAVVFSHVNNLHQWQAWSPWEKLDPQLKRTFEGPSAGIGAVYRWDGNGNVGAGSNTIIDSRPNELIRFKLDMLRPFVGTNDVEFQFVANGPSETIVTWTMVGSLNFMTKAMDMLIGMDKMVGGQFQAGLGQLKVVAESNAGVES